MDKQRMEWLTQQFACAIISDRLSYEMLKNHERSADWKLFFMAITNECFSLKRRYQLGIIDWLDIEYVAVEVWRSLGGADVPAYRGIRQKLRAIMEVYEEIKSSPNASQNAVATISTVEQDDKNKSINNEVNPMSAIPFETKHYIYGKNVADMTPAELIQAVKTIEKEIADLEQVKTKSKKIAAMIADLKKALDDVVEHLDEK